MRKHNARKVLSVFLTLMMLLSSVSAGLSVIAYAETELNTVNAAASLANKTVYTVSSDTTIAADGTKSNGLIVPANATVFIDIASGVTLTVKGGNADKGTAGKAGILMNSGSTLIITGSGNLKVTGGNGGNGSNGGNNSGTTPGNGGNGGAGGGAGIGGNGANGGGANGGASNKLAGSLTVLSSVTVTKSNGANSTTAGKAGSISGADGGGAGGGGGAGYGGMAIGGGGAGAGGGGNGTAGHTKDGCNDSNRQGTTGQGGKGAVNGGGSSGNAGGNAGTAAAAYSYGSTDPFANLRAKIALYADYYSYDMTALLEISTDTLSAVKADLEAAYNSVIGTYSTSIYNYYFPGYDTATLIVNMSEAIAMVSNIALAQRLQEKAGTTVDTGMTYDELNAFYTAFKTDYDEYTLLADATKAYLESISYIVVSQVVAKLAEYKEAMDVADLRENYYDNVTNAVATYGAYDTYWVAETNDAGAGLSAAKTELESYITALNNRNATSVIAVFGADYIENSINPVIASLVELQSVSDLKDRFAAYKSVYDEAFVPLNADSSDEALYNVLNARDGWYNELKAYFEELKEFDEVFANKVLNNLDSVMTAKINSVYTILNARVTEQIEIAYNKYQNFVAEYGQTINTTDDITIRNYGQLRTVFNQVKSAHYDFLLDSGNFNIPEETVAKYELIKKALFAFENYDVTKGLSAYEFNKSSVKDITRALNDAEAVRDKEYTVDKEKRAAAYENVKKLLESDLIKGLLGGDGEEEGGFSLDSLTSGLKEKIYSDSLVNTLVSFIYPFVTEYFAKTWAGLPETTDATASGQTVTINLDIVRMRKALEGLGLPVLPDMLAKDTKLQAYPEIQAALAGVTYDPVYNLTEEKLTTNPWADESLPHDEDGNLAFEWGVHDKESFVNAMEAALGGAEPLLRALISGLTYHKDHVKVGTGSGSKTVFIITVNVTVDPINLTMEFTGNDGYNNMLAPILSALGATNLPNGRNLDTVRKIAAAIADPLDQIITKLESDPLDYLLKTLPNLAFALENGLIEPLLNQLGTNIKYWADADYTTDCSYVDDGTQEDALGTKNDLIPINVGELLLGGLNLDFSNAAGFVNSIVGLLMPADEEEEEGTESTETTEPAEPTGIAALLPLLITDELFQKLAYTGDDVTWNKGYRTASPFSGDVATDMPYINATPSEVFAFLVNYLIDKMADDDTLLPKIAEALGFELDLTDTENPVNTIISNIFSNKDEALAAITELMLPQEYNNFAQLDTPAESFNYEDATITPSDIAYLRYANDWDEDTAEAVATNVDGLIPAITKLIGDEMSLNELLQSKLNELFTNANLTKLNNLLAGAISGLLNKDDAEEVEEVEEVEESGIDVAALLVDVLGIDLSAFAEVAEDCNWGFEDGDKAGFTDALCNLLAPLAPVLKVMLPGEDLNALNGVINLKGYDVYPKSFGLIFDALGIPQIENYASMTAQDELKAILNALLAWVDDLTAEGNSMIEDLLTILPDVVYFIQSNGLSVAIKNLIYPIQIVLDTVRPIYPVELKELISNIGGSDSEEEEEEEEPSGIAAILGSLDFDNLTFDTILPIVDEKLGTELVYSTLATYAIPALTISKGELEAKDVLTILLCGAIEALEAEITDGDNAGMTNGDVILGMIGNENVTDIYTKLVPIITGGESAVDESEIMKINWAYMYDGEIPLVTTGFDMPEYSDEAIINYLATYDKNEWTADTATYLDENLEDIVKAVLKLAGQDENLLANLISGLINDNIYTANLVNLAGNAISDLLGNLEDVLKETVDALLGTEIRNFTFTPVESVNGKDDFIAKMEDILNPFGSILGFVLFGEGYKFFNGTTQEDLITISGGDAYDAALVPVLEALGVAMPKKDTFTDNSDAVDKILKAVTDRLDEIAADPLNELLDLLPNLLYFLNADGLKAVINNVTLPFDELVEAVTGDSAATLLADVKVSGVALNDLSTENILVLIENLTGLTIPDEMKTTISGFYIGKAVKLDSANGKLAFRLEYNGDRKDMLTVLASVLLEVIECSENEEVFKGLIGEDIYNTIISLLDAGDIEFTYEAPDWAYMYGGDVSQLASGLPERTGDAYTKYTQYTNNWNEETASYVRDNLQEIIEGIITSISGSDTTLGVMLENAVSGQIYKDEVLNSLLETVVKLLADVDYVLISAADVALDVDIDTWFSWCKIERDEAGKAVNVTCTKDWGIDSKASTADKKDAFVSALTEALAPANRILAWFLLGQDYSFFSDSTGEDIITINGGDGYNYAIVPILEALGCEAKATDAYLDEDGNYDVSAITADVITALCDKVAEVCGDNTIDVVLDMLLNVIYFINADGICASVKNLLTPIEFLLEKLEPVIGKVDLEEAIGFPIKNITFEAIFDVIADSAGISIKPENKEFIETFYMGKVDAFTSANGETAYCMTYSDTETSRDMMTIILSILIENIKYEGNKDTLSELLGEETYQAINSVLSLMKAKEMQKFSWLYTEYADTDKTFSAIETSVKYHNTYNEMWTREMAQNVANTFPEFIDNLICLLGLEINGIQVTDLTALLEELVDGNLYTQANADKVLALFKNITAQLSVLEPLGDHLAEILNKAIGLDIKAWDNMTVTVSDGNREQFADTIAQIVAPLAPLFKVLLVNEDIKFFYDYNGKDQIVIPGSEGYAYGIVPLLEALGCENVLTPDEFKAVLDSSAEDAIYAVINPVLDRIDEIIQNPADELIDMLPGVVYFIDSYGVDTSVKNILNSVDTVIAALEPIIGASDVCTLAGIDLKTYDFNWIVNFALDLLNDATGYDFTAFAIDAIAELIVGKVVTYQSANGETYYTMEYASLADKADMVTIILRLLIEFAVCDQNIEKVEGILAEYVKDEQCYKIDRALVEFLAEKVKEDPSMSGVLGIIYYIYYGLDVSVGKTDDVYHEINDTWKKVLSKFEKDDNPLVQVIGEGLKYALDKYLDGVFDSEGLASDGAITFIQRLINIIKTIIEKIKAFFRMDIFTLK